MAEKHVRVAGLCVRWRDLTVRLGGRDVLSQISGDVEAGELLAVMGASGGGKTTLLNAISRRGAVSQGTVLYGEAAERWSPRFKHLVAVVEQDDHVFSKLTVGETLRFAAALRLPASTAEEREARVTALLRTLRLLKCEHTMVGSTSGMETRGISGGERKRMCIACELITWPSILICDEPTSGLDSSMAAVVAASLRDLAHNHGVTVITSIHQPSSQVFLLFDKLLLLHGGKVLHNESPSAIAARFATANHPCPSGWNIADWVLESLVQDSLSAAQLAELRSSVRPCVDPIIASGVSTSVPTQQRGWAYEFRVLAQREWKLAKPGMLATFRPFMGSTAFLHVFMGVVGGLLFYRLGRDEQDIFPRFTIAFNHSLLTMFFPLMGAAGIIPAAETMLRKDLSSGTHRLWVWFVINPTLSLLAEVPALLVNITISYWLGGVADDAAAYVLYMMSLCLCIIMFQSLGLLLSVLFPTKVTVVAMLVMTFSFLFSGVFQPLSETVAPDLAFINPIYYTECLLTHISFLEGQDYTPIGYDAVLQQPAFITRKQALDRYSLVTPGWASALVLLGLLVTFRTLAFWVLRRKLHKVLLTHQSAQAAVSWFDGLRRMQLRRARSRLAAASFPAFESAA